MPVRLTGLWSPSQERFPAEEVLAGILARFPAEAPWTRAVRRIRSGALIIDRSGDSADIHTFAESAQRDVGVAGTIRLEGRRRLLDAVGDGSSRELGDAGLVVAAYQRWGVEAFKSLTGAFAFVLWDLSAAPSLYLCRDPFGVRRLQFTSRADQIVFSTEIEGVLAWPETDRGLDDLTILDTLLGRYQTRTRTFFRSIRRVSPGHFVRFGSAGQSEVGYATPPGPPTPTPMKSIAAYGEAFRHELERAVSERLPASGPVVCHLSGGLDSASLACLAARRLEGDGRASDLRLVTARFAGLPCDEGKVAAAIAAFTRLPLHEWDGLNPEISDLEHARMAWPFGRSSIGGSWQGDLELATRMGASVLLSGQGGNQLTDEWGYLSDAWREDGLTGSLRAASAALQGRPWSWRRTYARRLLREARSGFLPPAALMRRARQGDSLYQPPPRWAGTRLRRVWSQLREETAPPPSTQPQTGSWMSDSVWYAATQDPASFWVMEHEDARATERGLEFRYPFLSWPLLALVMSVPWRLKAPRPHGRIVHREGMKGVVPDDVRLLDAFVYFNQANLANCRKALPLIERLLSRPRPLVAELVDPGAIAEMLRSAVGGDQRFSFGAGETWRLLRDIAALEAWLGQVSC